MKNNDFKYLIIGMLILAWGFFDYTRKQKRNTEIAELEDDLNRYVNGWMKYASIQKAIIQNGKGWWISNEDFNKQKKEDINCANNIKCNFNNYVAGNDTNERMPTIDDIKTAKIALIGVTEGVSFSEEFSKYPGRTLDGFWKLVNKNFFYLNRLNYLKKATGYEGKKYSKSAIKELEAKYQDLTLNNATEILLNKKTIQQIPG